jgi:hypothetical protein
MAKVGDKVIMLRNASAITGRGFQSIGEGASATIYDEDDEYFYAEDEVGFKWSLLRWELVPTWKVLTKHVVLGNFASKLKKVS